MGFVLGGSITGLTENCSSEGSHLSVVMIFVDFCKAFDSINHQTMFPILVTFRSES